MVTVTPGGLLTATGLTCGNTLVSATVTTNHSSSAAIVTGYMTANVVCLTAGAGASGPLTADFAGGGSGTVTSSPPRLLHEWQRELCEWRYDHFEGHAQWLHVLRLVRLRLIIWADGYRE